MPMLVVSAQELASIQADLVAAVCDQTCLIYHKTTTRGPAGEPLATYASTPDITTVAGVTQPTATHLANYSFEIGAEESWLVHVPVGTNVLDQDKFVVGGRVMEAHIPLVSQSYQGLLPVLCKEIE